MKEEAGSGRRRRRRPDPPVTPEHSSDGSPGRRQTPRPRPNRLSRGPRPAARPGVTEEILSHKTPKRILRKQQLIANHDSPVNDSELQQDIYWDQHSPTTFRLDNGKKKPVACQHAVKISDIVKRIAPQRSSEVPLNIWLGEDAIQCSPTVSFRERVKANNARFQRNTEEELMKLAKEFDRNMVEQDVSYGQEACDVNRTLDYEGSERTLYTELNHDTSSLEQVSVSGITESVKHSTGSTLPIIELHSQNSSQKSLDLEAEAAVNALFDGPTQHASRPLSQGFSGDDTSSPKLERCHTARAVTTSAQDDIDRGKGTNITRVKELMVSSSTSKQNSNPQASTPFELDPGKGPLFSLAASSEQGKGFVCENFTTDCELDQQKETNVQNKGRLTKVCEFETAPEDDGFDDWANDDWMEEDSFVMQITQNPELIATPKESTHFPKQSSHTLDDANQKAAKEFNDACKSNANSGIAPSVSFMQHIQSPVGKPKGTEMVAKTLQFGKGSERAKPRATFMLQSKASSKVTEQESLRKSQQSKVFKSVVNTLIKEHRNSEELPKPQHSSHLFNVPLRESTSLSCTKPFNQQRLYSGSVQKNTKDSQKLVSTDCSVLTKLNSIDQLGSENPSGAGSPRRVDVLMQSALPQFVVDDWNDAKFYDEIQNMFSESDSLWETGDDDDDLNRICDDVEKLIQSQSSEVTITKETIGLNIANRNQSLTNNAVLTSNMQKNQITERLLGQQKHLNQTQSSVVPEGKICSKGQLAAKQNAVPSTRPPLRPTGLACTVCTTATLPTQSRHLNSASNFQSKTLLNTTSMCALSFNRSNSMPGSGNGVGISNLHRASFTANFGRGQKLCTSTVTMSHTASKSQGTTANTRTPRFSFTKLIDSSVIGVQGNISSHVTQSGKTFSNSDHVKSPMEKNDQSNKFPTATLYPTPPLKRHFSDSTLQARVVESVEKPVAKCSLHEIEQKKRAALARRRMKMQAGYTNPSST
ncbi:ewing's tumor-associated antigen 1 [Heptranchias perlo]|uniref:ewing's tumor-associated antigen 1 n=1 Tax=Heptranchias perlo TaxID=212740 RepID=UPI00355A3C52